MNTVMRRSSRHRRVSIAAVVQLVGLALGSLAVGPVQAAAPGDQIGLSPWLTTPASRSTSGDFATDVFNDPWDFSNAEDVIPIDEVGTQSTAGVSVGGGMLGVNTQNGSTIRLLFDWPLVLPWGRDGWAHPIDAGLYTQTTFRICADVAGLAMAIRFENAMGQQGTLPFNPPAGCSVQHFDLTYQGPVPGRDLQYPFPGQQGPWAGPVVRFEIHRGGGPAGFQGVQLDWVRLHRADAPQQPPTGVPIPQLLTPNEEGGADYATTEMGNPWDFEGLDDITELHQVANPAFGGGALSGTTVSNDPYVAMRLGPELNTDRYRRLTIEACYDGPFGLENRAGSGMNGRLAWIQRDTMRWSETQDFVVFPGCHRMTMDLATDPAASVHDEGTVASTGWRGMRPSALRFDLNEDPGLRNFSLREVKLADDAAFSTNYDITFRDNAGVGGTAEIWVTTNRGAFDGTRIARDLNVAPGVNTFRWNGTSDTGATLPNGTYWVYIVMRNGSNVGSAVSSGPVRIEKPQAPTASYFVPLTPARLLDTRTGTGGNITPLGQQVFTELDVTGVGGVPETGVSAVVMNVTVDGATAPSFLTAWPSGEARPGVSNLNYVAGQTVPNLVTVKVGANGRVNLFNATGWVNVIADVVGYYTTTPPTSGGRFTSLTPTRLLDTRTGEGRGGAVGPVVAGQAIDVQVTGTGGVPASGVTGVALNVTVDQPTGSGYITSWPTGEARPTASTHNFTAGVTVANLVLAKVGAGGKVSLFNSAGATHLVADVVGYFSASGGAFVPVSPQRLVDSRDGTGGVLGQLGQGGAVTTPIATGSPVPSNASAAVVNLTSVNSSLPSFLTAWPSGVGRPTASIMNPRPGVPVPNQAYLKLGSSGRLDVYNNSGATDVIVDVFGYIV